jgi:AcrR family transcriptional regulator
MCDMVALLCQMLQTPTRPPLRERHSQQVRASILDALVTRLERESPEDIALDSLAIDAGVSRRTLYRHFPSKSALLAAAEDRLVSRLGLPIEFAGPEDISAGFRQSSRQLERYPTMARALRQTTATRLRPPLRARRLEALERTLEPLTLGLDEAEAQQMVAVIGYVCSANAWVTIGDESALPSEQIRDGVTWAIETLLAEVQRRGRLARKRPVSRSADPA